MKSARIPGIGRTESVVQLALLALSALVLGTWVTIGIAHADDRYAIDHVSGAWMALARSFSHGTLYPPLYSHGYFGGTRYMPLQIVLDGGLAKLTGEYLVSGKLVAYALMALLLCLLAIALRRARCSWAITLALTSLLLVTEPALLAATSVYGDVLPVTLQLSALLIVGRSPGRIPAASAGVLCAAAWLSKLSAVWAFAAIAIWLLSRNRRSALTFTGTAVLVALAGAAGFDALSDGRMHDNLTTLSTSGFLGAKGLLVDSPRRALEMLEAHAPAVWALFGVSLFTVVHGVARRRLTLYQWSLVVAALTLVVVLADQGTDWNHLLDVEVLAILVTGELLGSYKATLARAGAAYLAVACVIGWMLVSGWLVTMSSDLRAALSSLVGHTSRAAFSTHPLAGIVSRGDTLLSEDPSVPIFLGERPVVLDAFMLLRTGRTHPSWAADLIGRIDRRQFSRVVLTRRLDISDPWWRTNHFGPAIVRAVAANYDLLASRDGYWVYAPRRPRGATARA